MAEKHDRRAVSAILPARSFREYAMGVGLHPPIALDKDLLRLARGPEGELVRRAIAHGGCLTPERHAHFVLRRRRLPRNGQQ
jgi:hypothetical protein